MYDCDGFHISWTNLRLNKTIYLLIDDIVIQFIITQPSGTVDRNHGKLLTTAICPVLWHYGVPHVEVNGTE